MTVERQLGDSRRERIVALLAERGSARVSDLAAHFHVTNITIRRDLERLEATGVVERVHGGARLVAESGAAFGAGAEGAQFEGHVAMLVPALDFYWPSVARAAKAQARKFGLRLMLRGDSYDSTDERPVLEPLFASSDMVGLLAVPNADSANAEGVIAWIDQRAQPCVLMEREAVDPDTHEPVESVVSDHALGAEMAVRHLWGLGHRDIGLVVSRTSPTTRKIRIGFGRVCAELGIAPALDALIPSSRTPGFADAAGEVIDALRTRVCTALLVHSDREAMALVGLMETAGLRVPQDVSVVAYDDEVASMFIPALTAVRPAREMLGQAAIDLLVARLADPGRPHHRMVISPELHVRESTAAVACG
ncbi:MAG: substrate-binding domain-containing protein [Propionibacteriaceae bacterium]|nr:substrate-binding domain-containing protein [Propionibacteriaceae bacterium]